MRARSFSFGPSSDWGAEAASRMVPAYSQLSPKRSVARYATTEVALFRVRVRVRVRVRLGYG